MFRFHARGWVDYRRVMEAAKQAERRGIARAAAALRLTAVRGIRKSQAPSAPGRPPNTRKGRLRKAILYALLEERGMPAAVVGPSFYLFGLAGKAHEFGIRFRDEDYPARPFMGPALDVIANRLPTFFAPHSR